LGGERKEKGGGEGKKRGRRERMGEREGGEEREGKGKDDSSWLGDRRPCSLAYSLSCDL